MQLTSCSTLTTSQCGRKNNPSNLHEILDAANELRTRYVNENRPRLLQDNKVTTQELEIIRASGKTDRLVLPIWDDINEGYPRENVHMPVKDGAWEDAFVPQLSAAQRERGCEYQRPSAWLSPPQEAAVFRSADPVNIKQTVVGDCSLVCSLIVVAAYQQRFPNTNIITGVFYPKDGDGKPVYNPKGKYCIKMLVNGITRLVAVDDRFPVQKGTHALQCSYSKDPTELWVSLLEKAFIKVCGGSYEFPGSNSSTDMYMLSGWLPEYLCLDKDDFDRNAQWTRLSTCLKLGKMVMTLTTPASLSQLVQDKLKLIPGHAYACLDMVEAGGYRLLKIKNPWAHQSWEGLFSVADERHLTPELLQQLKFTTEEAEQGIFWMSWQDCCTYFSRAHISWNPYTLFPGPPPSNFHKPVRIARHGEHIHHDAFAVLPQFHLTVTAPRRTRFHFVLSRHILDSQEYRDKEGADDGGIPQIALHAYETTRVPSAARLCAIEGDGTVSVHCREDRTCVGRRIYNGVEMPEGSCVHRGIYRNAAHQTVSLDCESGDHEFTLVVARHKGDVGAKFRFSLTLHTELKEGAGSVLMDHLPIASLPFTKVLQSGWQKGTSCGGCLGSQTFCYNPQFRFTLARAAHLVVRIVTSCAEAVQLHVVKLREKGKAQVPASVPWEGRVEELDDAVAVAVRHCPMYALHCAVMDSSMPNCVAFDTEHAAPQPATPQPAAIPPPSSPPPPSQLPPPPVVTKCTMRLPKQNMDFATEFETSAPILPLARCYLLAQSVLTGEPLSKFICAGAVVPPNACFADVLDGETRTCSLHVLPGTEECPRTGDMSNIEIQLYSKAANVAKAYSVLCGRARDSTPPDITKLLIALNEEVLKLQLELDGMNCPTDEVKVTRKLLVCACNDVHLVIDLLQKPLKLMQGQQASAVVPAKPTSPPPRGVAVNFTPSHRLSDGAYTIVASVWKKGIASPFSLTMECEDESAVTSLSELVAEGSGYSTSTVQGAWASDNSGGPWVSSGSEWLRNPTVEFKLERPGIFCARVLVVSSSAVEAEDSSLPTAQLIIVSAKEPTPVTMSAPFGKRCCSVKPTSLPMGTYRAVVATGAAGQVGRFALRLFASAPLSAKLL